MKKRLVLFKKISSQLKVSVMNLECRELSLGTISDYPKRLILLSMIQLRMQLLTFFAFKRTPCVSKMPTILAKCLEKLFYESIEYWALFSFHPNLIRLGVTTETIAARGAKGAGNSQILMDIWPILTPSSATKNQNNPARVPWNTIGLKHWHKVFTSLVKIYFIKHICNYLEVQFWNTNVNSFYEISKIYINAFYQL